MKYFFTTLTLLWLGYHQGALAQSITQPVNAKPAPALALTADDEIRFKIANDIAINLLSGKFNLVTNNFDADLKTNLKEALIRQSWFQATGWRGDFIRITALTPGREQGLDTMNVICRFETSYVIIVVLFREKQVTGLYLK